MKRFKIIKGTEISAGLQAIQSKKNRFTAKGKQILGLTNLTGKSEQEIIQKFVCDIKRNMKLLENGIKSLGLPQEKLTKLEKIVGNYQQKESNWVMA